jgi:hypothetical protein
VQLQHGATLFIEVDQELWERTNHWAGDNGPHNQPAVPASHRITCTQGLPPTLSDPDPFKGAMETDFFPRATILLGPRCKQGDSVECDPVGKNQDFDADDRRIQSNPGEVEFHKHL